MEYNRLIAVTGLGGLFEMMSSKSDGAIVRSLEDKAAAYTTLVIWKALKFSPQVTT
jgi:hypothetical protein